MGRVRRGQRVVAVLIVVGVVAVATPAYSSADSPDYEVADCARADFGGWSVARVWNEALLELIRQVVPAPTVHARNLFHTSVAMWDAWAAYDPAASGYIYKDKVRGSDVAAARNEAVSYAA